MSRLRTWRASALLAVLLACAAVAPAQPRFSAGAMAVPGQLQVEAAFLINFIRYSEWPAQRFPDAGAPYVVAVVGDDENAMAVRAVARAAGAINGRAIKVLEIDAQDLSPAEIERLRGAHAVFVPGGNRAAQRSVLRAVDGMPILTVGEGDGFTTDGGMLGLLRAGDHLTFDANPEAIHAAGMLVSAKVLKLARIRDEERP